MIALALAAALAATPISLEEVRVASRRNTEALRAELEGRRASRSAILPHLGLEAGASGNASSPRRAFTTVPDPSAASGFRQQSVEVPANTSGNFNLSLTLSQLLYDGGRWWNQLAQSGALEQAALGQSDEQRLSSELEGVRRYYELYRAQRTLEVLEATAAQSAELVERANALFQAGRAKKNDAISAQVNLGNDRITALRQRQRITAAQVDLAVWLARSGADELVVSAPAAIELQRGAAPELKSALEIARVKRPLLRAVAEQQRAAQLGVDLANATYFPRISASATYTRQSPSADPFFTDPVKQNSLGAGLHFSWELFSGGGTAAQSRSAQASRSTAELNLAQAERELEGEVRRTHATFGTQLEVSKVAAENREIAHQGLKLAEERFQAGAGSTLEVRDAQLKVTQAELSALESRIDVEVAAAAVDRVLGNTGETP